MTYHNAELPKQVIDFINDQNDIGGYIEFLPENLTPLSINTVNGKQIITEAIYTEGDKTLSWTSNEYINIYYNDILLEKYPI